VIIYDDNEDDHATMQSIILMYRC